MKLMGFEEARGYWHQGHSKPSQGPSQGSSPLIPETHLWIILGGNEDKEFLLNQPFSGSLSSKMEAKTTPEPISSLATLETTLK